MTMTADRLALARQKIADYGTSAAQSIQIENATGGTFTATFDGQTTAAVAYNAGGNVLQNALCDLSNIGVGGAIVNDSAGVPNATFYTVYFAGALGNIALPMLTINSSLTGTGVIVTVQLVMAGGITAFSDDELNANYTLANGNWFLGVAYDFDDLCSNAAKFNRYTAGQTQEFKDQIYTHLKERAEWYHQWANSGQQVQFASMIPEPPRPRAVPWQVGVPSTSLIVVAGVRRGRWPGGW